MTALTIFLVSVIAFMAGVTLTLIFVLRIEYKIQVTRDLHRDCGPEAPEPYTVLDYSNV